MQLTRQSVLLLLRHSLQMSRERGKFPGPLVHLLLQISFLIAKVGRLQSAPAHVAVDQARREQNEADIEDHAHGR